MKNQITEDEYRAAQKELAAAKDKDYRNLLIAVVNRYVGKTDAYTSRELRLSRQAVSRLICGFKENGLDYYRKAKYIPCPQCHYTFEDIYLASNRYSGFMSDKASELREAERIFSSVLEKAGIPLSFFKTPSGEYRFNEDGYELLLDLLNHYKSDAYKWIRRQQYSEETAKKFAFLIGKAISNYQAICEDYPKDNLDASKISACAAVVIMSNIYKSTGNFDTCPGMSFLGGLPYEVAQNAEIILDDLAYLDPLIFSQFTEAAEGPEILRKRWRDVIEIILQYRIEEKKRIMAALNSEEFSDVLSYIDSFLSKIPSYPVQESPKILSAERAWVRIAKQGKEIQQAFLKKYAKETCDSLHNPAYAAIYEKLQQLSRVSPEALFNVFLADDDAEPAR